jgi:hypothetical protein
MSIELIPTRMTQGEKAELVKLVGGLKAKGVKFEQAFLRRGVTNCMTLVYASNLTNMGSVVLLVLESLYPTVKYGRSKFRTTAGTPGYVVLEQLEALDTDMPRRICVDEPFFVMHVEF